MNLYNREKNEKKEKEFYFQALETNLKFRKCAISFIWYTA